MAMFSTFLTNFVLVILNIGIITVDIIDELTLQLMRRLLKLMKERLLESETTSHQNVSDRLLLCILHRAVQVKGPIHGILLLSTNPYVAEGVRIYDKEDRPLPPPRKQETSLGIFLKIDPPTEFSTIRFNGEIPCKFHVRIFTRKISISSQSLNDNYVETGISSRKHVVCNIECARF